jgi:two-component system, cell cycle sensor histidine kinase and response regulator CckA
MGDRVTPSVKSADLRRAKLLKEALQLGTPILSHPDSDVACDEASTWAPNNLSAHRAYFEQLVECTSEAVSILDPGLRIVGINQEFTRTFGFEAKDALGKRIDGLIVPPERAAETAWICELLTKGQKVTLETKRKRKNGEIIDVFISSAPVVVEGKQVAIYALYRDTSEQRRAKSLSSALYRIAEKTSSAEDLQHFYTSIHGIVAELMYARNFYIALYDSASQLLSFPYFVDEQDPTPEPKKLGRGLTEYVLRTGEPLLCTPPVFDQLVKLDEVELIGAPSVDWMGVPLKAGNTVFGVLVVQSYSGDIRFGEKDRDILTFVSQQVSSAVEHKRNEEALRRSEARYRSLVLSAVYGIYRSNLDGRFLDVNPALISMLGYETAEEVLALDPKKDVFVNSPEYAELIAEFRRSHRLENVEVRWQRRDGNAITVRLSGRAVSSAEETEEVLEIIAEDVTERRVLEEQFRQSQKMEAVGRLAGGVAHDFNNLLMVISGYTEVLLERTERSHPVYSKIEAIQQASDRATTLTRQLLAFSRKQLLQLKVVDINAIMTDMERLLRPLIGENIELSTRLAADLGRTRADAGQVEQVIMNLVVNAKDAMPNGGRITIQTANVSLDDDLRREYSYIKPGPYVMFSVTDNGQGMSRETQSRIFEPFFTTKEKGKGTGLGLSTVYGIVKQSGGYVFTQSEVGRGTCFRIYLPRVEEAAEPLHHNENVQSDSIGSETVLLVEDEESVRQLVRETLELKGYRVLEAEDGEAAIDIAASHKGTIDLLITDVVMPGMSGRDLARKLAESRPDTAVLFLSGYTEDTIAHEGVLELGKAFLQKPFTLQNLSRKVREVLQAEPG